MLIPNTEFLLIGYLKKIIYPFKTPLISCWLLPSCRVEFHIFKGKLLSQDYRNSPKHTNLKVTNFEKALLPTFYPTPIYIRIRSKNAVSRKNIDTKNHLRCKHVLNEMLASAKGGL